MQQRWLAKDKHPHVIIVFGGWAIGPASLRHLTGDYDVLYLDDYRDLNADLDIDQYQHKTLVAFSFGVAASCHWLATNDQNFDRKIAINGTATPVDRRKGIPPVVFTKTHEGLTQDSYQAFLTHCFGSEQSVQDIDVDQRREELIAIEKRGVADLIQFDRILISSQDRIFPPHNLARAWAGQSVETIDAPHVPFAQFKSWEEIVA